MFLCWLGGQCLSPKPTSKSNLKVINNNQGKKGNHFDLIFHDYIFIYGILLIQIQVYMIARR